MTETWVAADRTSWKYLICPDEPGLGRKFSGFSENPRTCEGFAINLLGIPHRLVDFLKKTKISDPTRLVWADKAFPGGSISSNPRFDHEDQVFKVFGNFRTF